MYLQFALVAVLALTGLAHPPTHAADALVAPERVAQAVASTTQPEPEVDERDIVVPPVEATGVVAAPEAQAAGPGAADPVVADQLVTPERLESGVVDAQGFQTLGVTWPEGAEVAELGGEVRTRTDGDWSVWTALAPADDAPDAGTADAAHAIRGGTESVSIGDADAVQLSFAATAEGGPDGLSLALIGSAATSVTDGIVGTRTVGAASSSGAATVRSAAYSTTLAAAVGPTVITRAQWGAPAQVCAPDVASGLVGAVVHHTAGSNNYSTVAAAMQQIRNDAAYHITGRGWCDIGYNFIVDKWGNIYEGRANSLTQPVIGVHTGGFNTGTVGVSMLGTYDAVPSLATQQGVAQIIGWRLGAYGLDPRGTMNYWTGAGENSRYVNQTVTLPRIFGHRDTAYTACPGNGGYAALPAIRAIAADANYSVRFVQAKAVVQALYADILGRAVDPSGLQTWSAMLAGGSGQPALVAALTSSPEYIELRIKQAYNEVLGRDPEPAGMMSWKQGIQVGVVTVDDVKRRFYDSAEYFARSGGTPSGYVDLLYQTAFKRSAAAAEVTFWSARMAAVGQSAVVDGIWFSMEAATYRAGLYYGVFLGREPDLAGQQTWARVLLSSGEGAVRIGIAGSEEYRQRALVRFP